MTLIVEQVMSDRLELLRQHADALAAQFEAVGDATDVRELPITAADVHDDPYVQDNTDETKECYRRLVDSEKVRHAQQFFSTFGLQIGAALVCKSLPEAYAAARGAQALYLTGELVSNPARRVRETTQFVLTIMTPLPHDSYAEDAPTTLSPGQPGAVAARELRIVHQKVRTLIRTRCGARWDRINDYFKDIAPDGPTLGEPLNQEDLVGTLHEFTVGVFESLNALGVPYTDDDKAAWFHVWDIVGRHMGIGIESAFKKGSRSITVAKPCRYFLPLDPTHSKATLDAIRRRHHMESFEGAILVNALLAELQRTLPRGMKPFPASLMRYLLGNETANRLGITRGGWMQQWLLSLNSVPRIAEIVDRRRKGGLVRITTSELSAITTQRLLQAFVEEGRSGDRPFDVAPHFRNAWGLGAGGPRSVLE